MTNEDFETSDENSEEPNEESRDSAPKAQEKKTNENPLNRVSPLIQGASKKRGIYAIGFVTLGLIVCLIVFGGKEKKEEPNEEFNTAPKWSGSSYPRSTAQTILTDVTEKEKQEVEEDKNALRLKEARLKSAMVIFKKDVEKSQGNVAKQTSSSDPNQQFLERAQSQGVPTSEANLLGNLDTKILQGKMIDAVMETAIHSDLPGMVRAIVSNDIYGEFGKRVLLPRGSRLIGEYNSAIRKGQVRVFVVWNRAIRPDGIEIALHSASADSLGRSGIAGKVNDHFWKIFGASTLLSILGGGASSVGVNPTDQNNSLSAYREEIANSFKDSSSQVLNRYIDIPPTIEVKQGARIKILIARDLDFTQALTKQSTSTNQMVWVFHP